ncbi:Crp/Fnr family transcriptional regulator [Nisaea acidiphila]|uniref:Crp/Fnr family transcriptional regulator n=1 Tax=Nisaea acidiphila TaxID=1862145 RepID=A0A9J7AU64_9PROT|nr:Crp/Fnr family transcriptional regulator [Nisaea acidiphila]UUX49860.1 Crp/Fnr family transcriptional regulator [Nisaea acidiphila]
MSTINRSLAASTLLQGLPEQKIADLDKRCRWRNFEADQVIINLDDESTDVYFIIWGDVRVTVFSETGKTVIIQDLKTGHHFGEFAAIDNGRRSASIVAMSRTVVAVMPAEMFRELLLEFPELAQTVMRRMVGSLRNLVERVVEFSTLGVRNRIHAELLRLARAGRIVDNTGRISPPPTHAEIAARISTHREAVTRELKALERGDLLERTRGAYVVKDLAELKRMVDDARAGRE